eukprot:3606844-Lingulodinium_polyedra.AAC.1
MASFAVRFGGKRQRLQRALLAQAHGLDLPAERDARGPLDGDEEVDLLLELWALGLVSAKTLRDIAGASHRAAPRPQTEALSAIGKSGALSGNIHRDLARKLNLGGLNLPSVYMAPMPFWSTKSRPPAKVDMEYPVLLPHEILSCMYEFYPAEFNKVIRGTAPL